MAMGRLAGAFDPNFPLAFCSLRSLVGDGPCLVDGDAGSCSPPSLHTYSLAFYFWWFHLGLTVEPGLRRLRGPPCVGALIRTFLWLSVELAALSRGWPLLVQSF